MELFEKDLSSASWYQDIEGSKTNELKKKNNGQPSFFIVCFMILSIIDTVANSNYCCWQLSRFNSLVHYHQYAQPLSSFCRAYPFSYQFQRSEASVIQNRPESLTTPSTHPASGPQSLLLSCFGQHSVITLIHPSSQSSLFGLRNQHILQLYVPYSDVTFQTFSTLTIHYINKYGNKSN